MAEGTAELPDEHTGVDSAPQDALGDSTSDPLDDAEADVEAHGSWGSAG